MKNKNNGFTLIELLLGIAIITILLGQAIPSFNQLIEKRKATANVQRLMQTLQFSRTTAITENTTVTVCPTSDGLNCSSNWSDGYLSFKDINNNRTFDSGDEKLVEYLTHDTKSQTSWRAFGVRSSLQWLPTGITNHQNGSFELCYDSKAELARGLFITKAGRIRNSKDRDGDGIHENATGSRIRC
jgi:type IV fimbrial biogenesis protein FimT